MAISTTKKVALANAITHGGRFHADEVFGTVIISKILGDVTVYRGFNVPENFSSNVIVYDIGLGKFDHHQKGGNGRRENGVPYAACGLLWKEYGRQILENCSTLKFPGSQFAWEIVDKELIQGIDAVDCGEMPNPNYSTKPLNVSLIIGSFNPRWNSNQDQDEAFVEACNIAKTIFDKVLEKAISTAIAKKIVDESIAKSVDRIIVLDRYADWQDAFFASNDPKAANALFIVFPSTRGGYSWQCIPPVLYGTAQRKPVPIEWCGASKESLRKMTGVATANFCHPNGFLGSCDTMEDAIAMAKIAINS